MPRPRTLAARAHWQHAAPRRVRRPQTAVFLFNTDARELRGVFRGLRPADLTEAGDSQLAVVWVAQLQYPPLGLEPGRRPPSAGALERDAVDMLWNLLRPR